MATTEVTNAEKCRVIAEKVMGWHVHSAANDFSFPRYGGSEVHYVDGFKHRYSDILNVWLGAPFDPFTDPAAMVEVMEKIGSKAHNCRCVVLRITEEDGQWDCTIGLPDDHEGDSVDTRGPTPMHAVAEAAYAWAVK